MHKIEGVILDWAGTTVDYGCFAPVRVFMKIFEDRGIAVTEAETRQPMGMLKRDHIRSMLWMERIAALWEGKYGKPHTEADVDALYASFEPLLLACLRAYGSPKPKVVKTVEFLRGKGLKIGSTSGYTDTMMEIVAEAARQEGYAPDVCFTPDATGHKGRPYPYMIFRNMEALALGDVRRVLKVGDTVSDIKEGKCAGVWSVGVVEGSSLMGLTKAQFDALPDAERDLRCQLVKKAYWEAGADFVIDDIEGIFSVMDAIASMK